MLSGLYILIQDEKQSTFTCLFSSLPLLACHEFSRTMSHLSEQALQSELRNSEAKVSGLETQVSQLSTRVGRTSSSKAGGGGGGMASISTRNSGSGSGSGSGGGGETGSEGGREGNTARGNEVTEAEIASLRRQMKAAIQVGGTGRPCYFARQKCTFIIAARTQP